MKLGSQKISLWLLQVYSANFLVESRQNVTKNLEVEPVIKMNYTVSLKSTQVDEKLTIEAGDRFNAMRYSRS